MKIKKAHIIAAMTAFIAGVAMTAAAFAAASVTPAPPPSIDEIEKAISLSRQALDAWQPLANWVLGPAGLAAWIAALTPKGSSGLWGVIRFAVDMIGGNVGNARNAP